MTPETKEAIEQLKKFQDLSHCRLNFPGQGVAIHTALSGPLDVLIEAVEAMEPRPIEEAPASYESDEKVLVIGHYTNGWILTKTDGGWWRRQKEFGLKSLPTHFIPLSALPQPEVKNDGN